VDDIMNDSPRSKLFEEHLAGEFGLESLLFIRDVERWRQTFFDLTESARKSRARVIERVFIREDGLYTVNIPAPMSTRIIAALKDPNAPVDVTLFDDAVLEVKKLLNYGAVQRFLNKVSRDSKRVGDKSDSVTIIPDVVNVL
jgi:hypothetical protein